MNMLFAISLMIAETVLIPSGEHFLERQLEFVGKTNLVIRGELGAKYVLKFSPSGKIEENSNGFCFRECRDVTIENLAFTTDNPVNAQGRIAAVHPEDGTFDVRFNDDYKIMGNEHFLGCDTFDALGMPDYLLEVYWPRPEGVKYELLGDNLVRLKAPEGYDVSKLDVGHRFLVRFEITGNQVFEFVNCHGVTLRDVRIERASGAGVVIAGACKNFSFERFSIRRREGDAALFTENSDGIHILGLSGKLRLDGCYFDGLGDDCLNIHGKGIKAKFRPDGKLDLPSNRFGESDTVVVYDQQTFLEKNVAETVEGDIVANATRSFAAVEVRNSYFANNRARALLLQTKNVLVENCVFKGIALPAILMAPDLSYWNEVGPVRNVEIRNCEFERCAMHPTHGGCYGAIAVKTSHGGVESGKYPDGVHAGVHVIDNVFRDCLRGTVYMTATSGREVVGNKAVNCGGMLSNDINKVVLGDCWVRWCDQSLTVGNRHFEQSYHCVGEKLEMRSLRISGRELVAIEGLVGPSGRISVNVEKGKCGETGSEGLKITVVAGTATHVFWLSPFSRLLRSFAHPNRFSSSSLSGYQYSPNACRRAIMRPKRGSCGTLARDL